MGSGADGLPGTPAGTVPASGSAARGFDWRAEPVGLYLHIPFCQSKCIYCDFNSYARMDGFHSHFVEALCTDIRAGVKASLPHEPDCAGTSISTIFLGGGTPSVLAPAQIRDIIEAARERYQIAASAEVTMEVNPGTIRAASFEEYRRAGVNRLSLGVQVLDDVMLRKLGRIHTSAQAIGSYHMARAAGFDNINLDFIVGLPGQDLAHLDQVLERLLALAPLPEHLSLYSLIVEEHTPLHRGVARGLIHVPGDDAVAEMYELVAERLAHAGYDQYEISNWSRGRPCRHNVIYWRAGRYLAFGPGASGYWGDTRYSTLLGPRDYIERVAAGQGAVSTSETLDRTTEMGEFMMLGLRLNAGVDGELFERRFARELDSVFGTELIELESSGLIERQGRSVRLAAKGRLLGNEAFARFI